MLTVVIPGTPVAQGRPRFFARRGRIGAEDPPKSRAWKKVAAQLIAIERGAMGLPPFAGAVELVVVAIFPRPLRLCWKGKPMPREWHTVRPDASNIAKAAEDAATAAGGEAPSVVVSVRALESGQGREA